MTELQVSINNIKEVLIAGELLVAKIEKAQKYLEKPEVQNFPWRFTVVKDDLSNLFVIGLKRPTKWKELPSDFKGRAGFTKENIRQIITGLQTLLGEQQ